MHKPTPTFVINLSALVLLALLALTLAHPPAVMGDSQGFTSTPTATPSQPEPTQTSPPSPTPTITPVTPQPSPTATPLPPTATSAPPTATPRPPSTNPTAVPIPATPTETPIPLLPFSGGDGGTPSAAVPGTALILAAVLLLLVGAALGLRRSSPRT